MPKGLQQTTLKSVVEELIMIETTYWLDSGWSQLLGWMFPWQHSPAEGRADSGWWLLTTLHQRSSGQTLKIHVQCGTSLSLISLHI